MKKLLAVLSLLASISLAQQDTVAYKAATAVVNAGDKTKALEEFLRQYPYTTLRTKAYDGLFDLYVVQGNESASVDAAAKSLATVMPENRMNPYNRFAYALALKNIGLDSALAWVTLAEEMGYTVAAGRITRDDLYIADEAFFTGTAAEVTPIREVDGRTIGSGTTGPVTARLQKAFFDVVNGRNNKYRDWLAPVAA